MDTQLIETYEMNSMSLESTGELTSLEYLLNCPSYDPLKTPALAVNHILSWRLKYDNNGPTPAYIEFRPQDSRSFFSYLDTNAMFDREEPEVVVFFIQWLTTFNEVVFINEGIFRKLLRKYQVDPLFILGIGFPNTGCANSSFSYGNNTLDAYHLCLRYPSLSLPIHFALYFQYSFVTRRVCVIVLDGEIGTTQYHVGGNLQEITEQHGRKHRSNPPELHPFVYALPFLQHVGNLTDQIRNKSRDEVVDLEQKTGTSVYGAQATSDILNQASGQRDIETLTRRAHICGANVAESHKYLRVHLRAVREFTQGYRSFQERYCKSFHAGADLAKYRTEAERVEDILQLELDTCKGRQMELENLGRRVDIQINMLFSLTSQRESRLNTRIAAEAKKDSSAMKAIAVLGMVFLPGTFVSAILGVGLFNSDGSNSAVGRKWWIFVAATLPLTLVVFGVWHWWTRRERKKMRLGDEERTSTITDGNS